ncbi:MAG: permease [Sedimentibacter sp.]
MNRFKYILKRYKIFIVLVLASIGLLVMQPEIGMRSIDITIDNALQMLYILPPIFILLGLLDVWVKKETMVKYLGEKSGMVGVVIAFLLGSASAGPLYAAFPVAVVLLKKGSKLSNVLIMIGAWSTTKIPLLLFEASSMGIKFMVLRFVLDLFGIAFIAYSIEKMMSKEEKEKLYENASMIE